MNVHKRMMLERDYQQQILSLKINEAQYKHEKNTKNFRASLIIIQIIAMIIAAIVLMDS